jgi:hypothetical protein
MVAICRDHAANARAWRDGQMALRWVAAGMGEAAKQFRRVISPITASAAIYASAAHADEREAHIREVKRYGQSLPEGSYGRCNRQAIAARETRIAARRRAVEHATGCPSNATPRSCLPSPRERSALLGMRLTEPEPQAHGFSRGSRLRPGGAREPVAAT